jgi:hypothetical protein
MSATLTFRRPSIDIGFSMSPGSSFEAGFLLERIRQTVKSFLSAESLHGHAARELADTFLDSREENWDGYEGSPVSDETFLRTQEFLTRVLGRFPAPSASATPSGSLALEWFVSPHRRFLVSIGEDERIAYAGLFNSDPVHGTTAFSGDLPQEISQYLRRLFFL